MLDKFQNVLPFDLKKYMLERTLNTLKESAELADRHVVINGGLDGQAVQGQQAVSRIINNRFMGTKKMASTVSNGGNFNSGNFKPRNGNNQNFGKKKYCSFCKSSTHDYFECYKRPKSDDANVKNVTKSQHVGFVSVLQSDINTNVIDIEYNDIFAMCEHEMKNVTTKCKFERNVIFTSQNGDKMTVKCYRDNGATLSLVKKNVLPAKFLKDLKKVKAVGTLYNKCEVPLYKVKVQLFPNEQEKEVVVGIIDNECLTPLDYPMILANDFGHKVTIIDSYCGAVTRSQTKGVMEISSEDSNDREHSGNEHVSIMGGGSLAVGVKRQNNVSEIVKDVTEIDNVTHEIDENVLNENIVNVNDNLVVTECDSSSIFNSNDISNLNINEVDTDLLIKLQNDDKTLIDLFKQAVEDVNSPKPRYEVSDNGLLVRHVMSKFDADKFDILIVVPYCLRSKILKLAHDVPASGHLGQ